MVRTLLIFILCTILWCTNAFAITTARFNRDTIRLNETVELIIESDQTSISRGVDYTGIEKQFRIVSKRRDTNVTVMNGQSQLVHRWRTELAPKSVGSFGVGPITVDQEDTNRLRLTVLPQAEEASVSDEVFIELEVDKDSVYVQQQILLVVNLFISVRLLDGALVDPAPENTLVRRVGKDVRYEAKRGGTSYAVFQRRYVLIPQKSGELVIPAMQFEGLADDIGVSNSGVFNPLFGQGRRIYANGKAIKINVKPPAAGFSGKHWLPSDAVTITEESNHSKEIEVGQPITRKIRLQGTNVTAEQLPEPVIGEVSGIRSYPDQSRLSTEDTENGVIGSVSLDIAMIGSSPGEITLPEISVPWWNTQTDQMETAVLPSRVIRIVANALAPNDDQSGTEDAGGPTVPADSRAVPLSGETQVKTESPGIWKWLAIVMTVLWLLTIGLLIKLNGRQSWPADNANQSDSDMNLADHYQRIQKACGKNNALETRNALIAWARARYARTVALPQIADLVMLKDEQDQSLRAELLLLDKALFSSQDQTLWKGGRIWRLFEQINAESTTGNDKSAANLPVLYPAA